MQRRDFLKTAGVGTAAIATIGLNTACTPPSWISTAEGIISFAVNAAGQVLSVIDPALAPLVTSVLAGFNALLKALQDYQAALAANGPSTTLLQAVQLAFATLKADAASLLSAFPGSGSAIDTIISAVIGLIATAISNIGALLPPALTATAMQSKLFPAPTNWQAKEFKSRFNADVAGDSRFHKV